MAKDGPPTLLWFRRDLRLADHPALLAALKQGGPIVPVFILEDGGPVRPPGAASRWWLDKSLRTLSESLRACNSRLVVRRGNPEAVFAALVGETGAGAIAWLRTHEPAADARDARLPPDLKGRGVEVLVCEGKLLIAVGGVRTQGGGLYGVFSPFWRKAQTLIDPAPPEPAPKRLPAPDAWPRSEPVDDLRLHPSAPDWSGGFASWLPGEDGARTQLASFLADKLETYPHDRDRPAVDGSSRLSPHLAWGEISPRQIYCAARQALSGHALEGQVGKFLTELGWRDFDYGLLLQQPALDREPFKPSLQGLGWRRSPSDLQAWQRGRTGYPIVDAGMRQLWQLGWMHNRVRLITASFLVKHLLIDWREGESWFWDCLIDADPANNPANWQWVAGVGADAQPFFRIFNPISQAERFDPEGDYVRTWVPELAKADKGWIHSPWRASSAQLEAAGVRLGDDYPNPIVAHETARARALGALRALRERADA